MFRLTYRDKYDPKQTNVEIFNDTKDVGYAILDLTDSEKEANAVIDWCNNAGFGDRRARKLCYILECVSESQLNKPAKQKRAKNVWHIQYSDLGKTKTDTNHIARYVHSEARYIIEPVYSDKAFKKISAFRIMTNTGNLIRILEVGDGYVKGNITNAKRIAEQSWTKHKN